MQNKNLYGKLLSIQVNLNCPKNLYNAFGKYSYRSTETILEAVKPLLKKHECLLLVSDNLEQVGDRYYLKATARLIDIESNEAIEATAFAREASEKKGQDEAQITGSASSYARKYALNGLFCINDEQDADSHKPQTDKNTQAKPKQKPDTISQKDQKALFQYVEDGVLTTEQAKQILSEYGYKSSSEVLKKDFDEIFKKFTELALEEGKEQVW